MEREQFNLIGILLLMIITGIWLSRRGKPYSILIQTFHKLIGAGGAFYAGYLIIPRLFEISTRPGLWALAVFSILFFLILIVTGGLLATEKKMPVFVLLTHKVLPYLVLITTSVTAYLVI